MAPLRAGLADPAYVGADLEGVPLLRLPPTAESGAPWDRGGAPAPYIVVRSEAGEVLSQGETVQDAGAGRFPIRGAAPRLRLGLEDVVMEDDVAADSVVARYRVRLSEATGLVTPGSVPLAGPAGRPLAELSVRWIEAAG